MASFDALVEAQLSGRVVRWSPLVFFDFKTQPMRIWRGKGDLFALGQTWSGLNGAGSMNAISSGPNATVEEMQFAIAGPEALLVAADDSIGESDGRAVEVIIQFFDIRQFDEAGNPVEWKVLQDAWFYYYWGTMGPLTIELDPPDSGTDQTTSRSVQVIAQNVFYNRARPAYGFFSDIDQKARTGSNDNVFLRVPFYVQANATWPVFSS